MNKQLINLAERAASTFLFSLGSFMAVAPNVGVSHVDWVHGLDIAAGATVLSLSKNVLAALSNIGAAPDALPAPVAALPVPIAEPIAPAAADLPDDTPTV